AATRSLVDNNLKDRNIKARVKITGRPKRLAPRLEGTAFRVIQEAVNNIARHAGARNASISLSFKKSAIRVTIKDDGAGFDVKEAISSKDRPRGLGLLGMKERVELVNGKLDIRSDPIGGGTEIEIDIPLKETDHG
ncbi:MAG: ATP-binding protein, partial [Chloroflexi bacterium]|nr:ATP-binding protein [Chloroflexota bacterium]